MPRTAASDEPRRSAKWKARRDVIIDTSAPVFARRGYHATGIAELCEVNGLGKGAFYHYIESKEELLAAIHDRVMDEVMLGADRVADSGRVAVRAAGHAGRRAARRHPPLPRSRLGVPPRVPGAHRRTRRAVPRAPAGVRARVEAVLQAGVDAGEFRDVDPQADRVRVARHAQLHVPVAEGGRPRCRRATSRSRSPTSSSEGSPSRSARGATRSPSARTPGARRGCRRPGRPARRRGDRRAASRSAPGSRGTSLRRAGSRCPTRSSTTR